ncbi:MAG: helix-turn-helix transcriptional regulator [Eubacteriaceae bacterium]
MNEKVRELRENAGLTQGDMASLLGLTSINAYSMKERGQRRFSLEEAKKISDIFKMKIEDIFFDVTITSMVNLDETG